MAMIDDLHQRGIGVILDWVPAHFPTDAHGLGLLRRHAPVRARRSAARLPPRLDAATSSTTAATRCESFLISSAIVWLDRYHVDGLRVDGVASMLYLDYSRKAGEWIPNEDGANHDREAIAFLQQFNRAVYARVPRRADDRRGVDRVARRVAAARARRPRLRLQVGPRLDARHARATSRATRSTASSTTTSSRSARSTRTPRTSCCRCRTTRSCTARARCSARCRATRGRSSPTCACSTATSGRCPARSCCSWAASSACGASGTTTRSSTGALGAHPAHAGIARWVGDLNARVPRRTRRCTSATASRGGFDGSIGDDRDASVLAFAAPRRGRRSAGRRRRELHAGAARRLPHRRAARGLWRELLNTDAGGLRRQRHRQPRRRATPSRSRAAATSSRSSITAPPLGVVVFAAAEP